MKKALLVLFISLLLFTNNACGGSNGQVKTAGTIIQKEVVQNNYYNFYVEYEIEGYEGTFTATIMIKDRKVYDSYEVGDIYMFERPNQ